MNQNIGSLYQFLLQQMAADAYLDDIPPGSIDELRKALIRGNNRQDLELSTNGVTRFTAVQADEFLQRYLVIHQLSDNPSLDQPTTFNGIPLDSGFSATLIREKGTDNYTLAIRSTEIKPWSEGGDRERDASGADLMLGLQGFAWAQIDTMEKYYAWLKSSGMLPAGARLNVTGYSLGGHLATVFTELHRTDPAVQFGETVTFNAPGRGFAMGSIEEMLAFYRSVLANPDVYVPANTDRSAYAAYLNAKAASGPLNGLSIYKDWRALWAQLATQRKFATTGLLYLPASPQRSGLTNGADMVTTQVYGREFPDDRSVVVNTGMHGPARSVFVEAQPLAAGRPPELGGTGDYAGGHSIVLIADSLAVMRALNQLDPTQTIDSLSQLFVSASSRTPDGTLIGDGSTSRAEFDALENVLDALRRALLGYDLPRTEYGVGARGFGDIAKRDGFYNNLDALMKDTAFTSLAGKASIVPIKSSNALDLAKSARSDFADFIALQTLSPFAVKAKAADAAATAALTAAWTSEHGADYAAWNADAAMPSEKRNNGSATFTDAWYRDRSALLRWVLKANEQNIDYAASGGSLIDGAIAKPTLFQDLQSQTEFTVSAQALADATTGVTRVLFGRNDAPDTLTGAELDDRLYGAGGSDLLDGVDGNDYLEGNSGNDVLRGGRGMDVLLGGSGGDELDGGPGNDRMLGGTGTDVYTFRSGDGLDTIVDADGLGRIDWDGLTLTGGLRLGERLWRSADGQFTYSLNGEVDRQTLTITKAGAGGKLTVENFSAANRDLAIWLSDAPVLRTPPSTTRAITGDLAVLDTDPATPGIQWTLDDLGNLVRTAQPEVGRADFLADSGGNDLIRAGGGADFIGYSRGGSDDIDAGAGNDGVSSGNGDDWIGGGDGADELAGGNGSDVIAGGAGDDVIMTEHEIAYDSSTYNIVVPTGASVIRQWTYDDRFASAGYGIQVVQYAMEGITFESPWVGIGGFIERRDSTASDFVDAGDGSDLVYGGYGSDVLLGGSGSDRLEGSGGDDFLEGGSGNDVIAGDAPSGNTVAAVPVSLHGNDQIFGGTGDDLLLGGGGSDVLDGGDGNDVLYGDVAGMNLGLPAGTPYLEGTSVTMNSADTLWGGAGNDRLDGEAGDDVLIGGTGNDILTGGQGADVFAFDRGDGADTIFAGDVNAGPDELRLGAAIDSAAVTVSQVDADLLVDLGAPGDSVTVKNWFAPAHEQQVATISFADGTVWSSDQINARFVVRQVGTAQDDVVRGFLGSDDIAGLAGNDDIRAGYGNDLIDGGKGNDTLDGGPDNDRYIFRAGDGNDVITSADPSGNDVLQFVGIRRGDATLTRVGDALVITANNGLDKVTISRYFETRLSDDGRTTSAVQSIEFDGGVRLSVADVRALFQTPVNGTAGADYLVGGSADEIFAAGSGNDLVFAYAGNDTLLGGDGNDNLDGGVGADVFDGGAGDDVLVSSAVIDASRPSYLPPAFLNNGDDTFVFARGYGHDTVQEDNPSALSSTDTVVLTGLLPADVAFGRGDSGTLAGGGDGDKDLVIRVHDTGDTLRVAAFFDENPRFWVETVRFADGTTWNRDQIIASLSPDGVATPGADFLLGSPRSDSVDAGAGNDVVWLGDGNDAAEGGDGDDHLQGGAGLDYLSGGAGSDRLYGGPGADTLDGGPGDDYLFGGPGPTKTDSASDTYVFRRGSGHDRVGDTGSSGDADLVLLEGLGASDVELGWTYNNALRIRVTSSGDELVFDKHFDPVSRNKLEAIQFADGTTYDAAAIESLARQNKDEFLFGTSGADLIDAGGGDDDVHGGAGDDRLLGGTGNDSLDGESGADIMDGGQGNDSFVVDNAGDVVSEAAVGGVDRVAASVSFVLPENVESLTLVGTSAINGTGNALDNVLTGNSAANRLDGGAGNDVLNGGAGADTLAGGAGDDTYYVDNTSDTVTENANEGTDLVIASVTRTLGVNQENLTLSGTSAINGTGNPLNNLLKGNAANNTLNGAAGTDVLQGAAGSDTVTDTSGRGIHDGGDGADTLIGGTDRQFFAGGTGDDVLTLGGGADVIGFNRGHGADVINAPTNGTGLGEKNDTVSLSGVTYRDLRLARDASDLVLKVAGTADSVRLKGWYGSSNNQTINQLQLIVDSTADYNAASSDPLRNKRVIQVNFGSIVAAFDAAGSPSDWAVPEATLAAALVAGSDVDAIGGQLAYRYAKDGNFAGVDLATAVSVLNDAGFATAAQSIGMGATSGGVRLAKSLASTTSAPALDPQAALVGPSATLADDWVTAQPVQRVVAPDAPEPTVSAGGGFAPYLTQADVARALYGIDSAAGERTTIETYDYAFPVEQVAGDLFAFNEQRHLAIARQWEVAEAGSRGFAGDIGFSSAIGDERQPVVPAYWMLAADVNPGEIGRRRAVAR